MNTTVFIIALVTYGTWYGLIERWRVASLQRSGDHQGLWMAVICDACLILRKYRFRLRPSDDIVAAQPIISA
ncbi:MAG TPA: hypothetical protein VMT22_18110 [Terriglobales bacterium]|nr:hypothetical protein [Terriglobales bacterium]